jgi:hypothetical protein
VKGATLHENSCEVVVCTTRGRCLSYINQFKTKWYLIDKGFSSSINLKDFHAEHKTPLSSQIFVCNASEFESSSDGASSGSAQISGRPKLG